MRDFRLAGVDKDEATRKRIKELRDELVVIGQEFARNIRDDKRTVIANSVAELDGLPADSRWITGKRLEYRQLIGQPSCQGWW